MYLQQAVEDVTGRPFEETADTLMKTLGMAASTYRLDYLGQRWVNAAYSLETTAEDLARFLRFLVSAHPVAAAIRQPHNAEYGLGIRVKKCGEETYYMHTGRNFGSHHAVAMIYEKSRTGAVVMARGAGSRYFPQEAARWLIGAAD